MAQMLQIAETTIGTNRYAPAGSAAVKLYGYNGAEELTVAQLVSAVCMRRVAQLETQGVSIMNQLSLVSDQLDRLSEIASAMLNAYYRDGGVVDDWESLRKELVSLGCTDTDEALPKDISSYANLMTAYQTIEDRIVALNSNADKTGIELQTAMSRRDVTFTLASNTTKHLGNSAMTMAAALRR